MKFAVAVVALCVGAFAPAAEKDAWYARAVKSVVATVEPAEAKPGQTVVFKLTVELNDGYFTYPTKQPDENAKSMVNKFAFPKPETLVFVGDLADPIGYLSKDEPVLGITDLRTYKGSATFERKAVVSPKAKPGEATVTLEYFKLSVCDAKNCFPAKTLQPEARFKVLAGAVEVEKRYSDEVKKAIESK
jgi:hypothetical protein